MTIPFEPIEGPEGPTFPEIASFDGLISGAALSALNSRTQENVTEFLREQMQGNDIWSQLWDLFWGFLKKPFQWIIDILKKLFPWLPWDDILEGDFLGIIEWVLDKLKAVPFLGDLISWLIGAAEGTWETLQEWFEHFWEFMAHINFLGPDFDLLEAAESFIEFILFPVWKIVPWDAVISILEKLFPHLDWEWLMEFDLSDMWGHLLSALKTVPFLSDLIEWLTGATSGTWETLQLWFSNLWEFLGHLNFLSEDFDLIAAAEDFIDFILFPAGKIVEMVGGLIPGFRLPEIDATMITGFFSVDKIFGIGDWIKRTFIDPIISALTGNPFKLDFGALGVWANKLLNQNTPIPAENLFGQISSALLGLIPVGHISGEVPNLLEQGSFELPSSVDGGSGWEFDPSNTRSGSGGSVKVSANGTARILYSTQSIPCSGGDKIQLSGWIKTASYAGSGSPIFLSLIPFVGTTAQTAVTVASRGSSSSWVEMSGTYTVPAGTTSVRVRLGVSAAMTGGTVYWDDLSLRKIGLLQQGLVDRLTDAWNNFWRAVNGGSPTGKTVDDVYTAGNTMWLAASNGDTQSGIANSNLQLTWNNLWDAFNGGSSGASGKTAGDVKSLATNVTGSVFGTIDGIVNGFRGWVDSGFGTGDAAAAAADVMASVAALNGTVANLVSRESSGTYSGKAAAEVFSSYSDGSSLGGKWSQWYSGGSAGHTLGVYGGVARWGGSTTSPRYSYARYANLETAGDYQRVGAVFATMPSIRLFTNYAASYILARVNASNDRYVFAKLTANTASIGYFNGSIEVTLNSVAHNFVPGATYWFEAGVGPSSRGFRLYSNNNPVLSATDWGSGSSLGAGYRYAGVGGYTWASGSVGALPGAIAAFAMNDNAPPSYRGSGFRASREDTLTRPFTSGSNLFESNWYGTLDYKTDDLTWDPALNKLTVTVPGWYAVTINQFGEGAIGPGSGGVMGVSLFKNGAEIASAAQVGSNINTNFLSFGGTFMVYLEKNDYLQPGYTSNWSGSGYIKGSAGGKKTFWTVNFVNNRLPFEE